MVSRPRITVATALAVILLSACASVSRDPFDAKPRAAHGDVLSASLIEIENLVVERRIGPAAESIPKEIASSSIAELVAKLDESTEKAFYRDIEETLRDFVQHDGIVVPQEAHLVRATRP